MAVVKFTAIVAEMRNKLNGNVFSKNRAGNYLRNKVTPVNPQTSFQQNQRDLLTQLSQSWRSLTEPQRLAWIAASANFPYTDIFGDKKTLSGQGLYMKLNLNIRKVGGTIIANPPAPGILGALLTLSVTMVASTGVLTITWTNSGAAASQNVLIEATPAVDPGIYFVKNRFRVLATALLSGSPFVGTTAYAARFGAVSAGQKVYVRVSVVNNLTGQTSVGMVASAIAS